MACFTYCNTGTRVKLKTDNKSKEIKLQNERRKFLKKAVYTAPSLVVLGSLAKPVTILAACGESGGVPPPPGGCNQKIAW